MEYKYSPTYTWFDFFRVNDMDHWTKEEIDEAWEWFKTQRLLEE